MKLLKTLQHLFVPHESNNLKAKILHTPSLFALAVALIFYQAAISLLPGLAPRILGYAANIPPSEVIRLTNERRIGAGLSPLSENGQLSQAALAKGGDMLARGYWAHVSPDGTQPWTFISNAGYSYRYAGENLARDFSNPSSVVDAWMNSPTHKDNLLSAKYKEIGIAVIEGSLAGVDTTIVVQMFGTKYADTLPAVPVAKAEPTTTTPAPSTPRPTVRPTLTPPPAAEAIAQITPNPTPAPGGAGSRILISPFYASRTVSLAVVLVLIALLSVDVFVVSHRRITRAAGRTFAHLAFFGMVLTIIIILKAGQIL